MHGLDGDGKLGDVAGVVGGRNSKLRSIAVLSKLRSIAVPLGKSVVCSTGEGLDW